MTLLDAYLPEICLDSCPVSKEKFFLKPRMEDKEEILDVNDGYLPVSNISRIMKSVLPPEGKISKDAKECVQECLTEFIGFITSE